MSPMMTGMLVYNENGFLQLLQSCNVLLQIGSMVLLDLSYGIKHTISSSSQDVFATSLLWRPTWSTIREPACLYVWVYLSTCQAYDIFSICTCIIRLVCDYLVAYVLDYSIHKQPCCNNSTPLETPVSFMRNCESINVIHIVFNLKRRHTSACCRNLSSTSVLWSPSNYRQDVRPTFRSA